MTNRIRLTPDESLAATKSFGKELNLIHKEDICLMTAWDKKTGQNVVVLCCFRNQGQEALIRPMAIMERSEDLRDRLIPDHCDDQGRPDGSIGFTSDTPISDTRKGATYA